MSANANDTSPTNGTSTQRTATQSRRAGRQPVVEPAPSKLHRSRAGHSPTSSGVAHTKPEPVEAASPEPVVAKPRGTTTRSAAATKASTPGNTAPRTKPTQTTVSLTRTSPRPTATTAGRPSTPPVRSSTKPARSTNHLSAATAAAAAPPPAKQAPRRSTTPLATRSATAKSGTLQRPHPTQPSSIHANTTGGDKATQHHVLQADDPVFVQMRRQRRASSTGSAMSTTCLATGQHFELLAADEPVPEMPHGLEKELVRQYTENLLHFPLSEVERVVGAMCHDMDFKLVMTYMKGEMLRLKSEAKRERSPSAVPAASTARGTTGRSGAATVVAPSKKATKTKKRSKSAPAGGAAASARAPAVTARPGWVKTPKVGETTAEASQRARSGRITARPAQTTGLATSRRRGAANAMTPAAQEAALERFNAAFTNAVRYAFLQDAGQLCNSRRIRFYHEQPSIVRQRNIVIPDDVMKPVYGQIINKLIYRILGWSEEECKPYTPAVVDIVMEQMNGPASKEEASEGDHDEEDEPSP